jgi:hypothetical protein
VKIFIFGEAVIASEIFRLHGSVIHRFFFGFEQCSGDVGSMRIVLFVTLIQAKLVFTVVWIVFGRLSAAG